jgi:hypothetical protein
VWAPGHLPVVWCLFPLFRPLSLAISVILRLDVNTLVILFISLFVALCVKLDHDTHKGTHSVLALNLAVT